MSDGHLRFLRLPVRAWTELSSIYAPQPFRYVVDATRYTRAWRVAVVVVDTAIVGAAVVRRYGRPGSGQDGLEFITGEPFSRQCEWADLAAKLPERLRPHLSREDGVPFPPVTGRMVLAVLEDLIPGASEVLARLAETMPRPASLGARATLLREQRDAVALGLEIAGLNSRELLGGSEGVVAEPDDDDPSFLRGWNERRVSEPATVRHDSTVFDGWLQDQADQFDTASFRDPNDPARRVTVIYADKEALERQTGTDLLYYRHHRPGFILVQYKRMRTSESRDSSATYYPDAQLHTEISRFRSLPVPERPTSVEDWRLTDDSFFVKLVRDDLRKPKENKLVFGMYLPLGLVDLLLHESQADQRPKGWSAESVNTYLSNQEFLLLAKQGYIGTRGSTTEHIQDLIRGSLEEGRGVVTAVDLSDPQQVSRLRHG